MKRIRKNKPIAKGKDLFANYEFNKETNKPPFVPTLCIYKGNLAEIIRDVDSTTGKAKLQLIGASVIIETRNNNFKRVPKGIRLTIWEFVYNRKWYIENHYAAGNREAALFELNLYLKHIEKEIIKKYTT